MATNSILRDTFVRTPAQCYPPPRPVASENFDSEKPWTRAFSTEPPGFPRRGLRSEEVEGLAEPSHAGSPSGGSRTGRMAVVGRTAGHGRWRGGQRGAESVRAHPRWPTTSLIEGVWGGVSVTSMRIERARIVPVYPRPGEIAGRPRQPNTRALVPPDQLRETFEIKPIHCRGYGASLQGDDLEPLRHQVAESVSRKPLS